MICIGTVSLPVSHRCKRMTTKVKKVLSELDVPNGSKIAVAFSGGCDSSALLHTIVSLASKNKYEVCAIHINHCLRGEESDADESFAKRVCDELGVDCYSFSVDVNTEAKKNGESTELCARRLRYEFFDGFVEKGWYVATAHTASDNAETVLFNLTRGTGVTGACGIPHKRGNYIRPLIYCTRNEVESYCKEHSICFVTDSSNLTDDYTRNFIRHNVVPKLKEINPCFETAVSEFPKQMKQLDDMLDLMAKELLSACRCKDGYNTAQLLKAQLPILTEVIRLAVFEKTGKYPNSKKILQICDIINAGKVQIFDGWYAAGGKKLRIYKESAKRDETVDVSDGQVDFGDFTLNFKTISQSVNILLMKNAVDCDKIVGRVVVRSRKTGDTIRLKGRPNKQVRKLMNEMMIPDMQRDSYPLVCDDEGVVFIQGCGVAERVLPDDKTKKMIIITCEGENNAQG